MGRATASVSRAAAALVAGAGGLLVGDFKLSSGGRSRYYVDVRRVWGDPAASSRLVDLAAAYIAAVGLDFDVVAGVATGGLPLAALLSERLAVPMAYVRVERKGHGLGRLVEGAPVAGRRVLVVDDVATTGGSLARAVEALREEGAVVEDAFVVVDRGEGAAGRLGGVGVRLHALTTLSLVAGAAGVGGGPDR